MTNQGREYEIAFKLNAEMESKFRKTFGAASDSIENLERELRSLSRSGDVSKMEQDIREAERAFHGLSGEASGFGNTLRRVAEYTGAFAIVQGVAHSFQNVVGAVGEYEDSMARMYAATGISAAEMAEIEEMTRELYELPIGDNFTDLSNAITTVRQVTKAQGDELERMTREAVVFRDVFGEDVPESVKAADTMMRNFGVTSTEAFNLLAQGAQNGLNKSQELLDSANEYTPHFAALGFSADQMFDTFSAGLESGAFNLDKVGDAVKEFNIRSKDMSKTSVEAYEALGLSAEEMSRTFAEGGPAAQAAFRQIVQSISSIEDPVQKNAVGVGLFGTMFEDLEADVIAAMGTAQSQFDMTRNTMEEIEAITFDTLGKEFQQVGRQLMTDLVLPMAEELLPVLQSLSAWGSENRDLVQILAMATPAAVIGKNVATLVKGFNKVDDAALIAAKGAGGASRAIGGFGSAAALLTNPVGIAVGAVGALTLGVLAYRREQEKARQELIHMGDELEEATQQYQAVADKAALTNDLVWEYERLDEAVRNSTVSSDELVYQKQRMVEIEKQLQELFPNTISQHDLENGRIREKLGLLKMESDAERELAALKLEREVAEGKRDLPKLEKELETLGHLTSEYEKQDQALDAAIPAFKQMEAEMARIFEMDDIEERAKKLEDLRNRANEIGSTVGKHFGHVGLLEGVSGDLEDKRIELLDKFVKKSEELQTAAASYQELYETQVALIELDLGGSIDETAKGFRALSEDGKSAFQEAMRQLEELNREMDKLPTDQKINLEVVWQQTTAPVGPVRQQTTPTTPSASSTPLPFNLPKLENRMQQFIPNAYGDGGIVDRPEIAWLAEKGDREFVIPDNNSPRSHALLDAANHSMGRGSEGTRMTVTFSPKIILNGGGTDVAQQVDHAVSQAQIEFERRFQQMLRNERRLNFRD